MDWTKAHREYMGIPGYRSLRICVELSRYMQIRKKDLLRKTIKTPQRCQTNKKMFKTGEKRRLFQKDEIFFCSNLYRSGEITELYRAKQ